MKTAFYTIAFSALLVIGATGVHAASYVIIPSVGGEAAVGKPFILDGTQSQDDGVTGRYLWRQISGPTVKVVDAANIKASFTPPSAGTYVFELSVTDSAGRTSIVLKASVVASPPPTTTTSTSVQSSGDGTAITPVFLEIGGVEGDTGEAKGNVEFEWKVEEGEKAEEPEGGEKGGTEDINIGVGELKGGVSVAAGDINGLTEEEKASFLATVKTHAQVQSEQDLENFAKGVLLEDAQMEQVSLNFEKIQVKYRGEGRLLGFIPVGFTEEIEVAAKGDTAGSIKVKFPWYSFLISKDVLTTELEDEISKEGGKEWIEIASWSFGEQAQIFTTISNVLKTKHDTVKNSIGNVR